MRSLKFIAVFLSLSLKGVLAASGRAGTVGVEFDYSQEQLLVECWNHLFDGQDNYWFPGPWANGDGAFFTASCNGLRETLPGQGFRLRAEASADAAHHGPILGVQEGSVETRISYLVPYTLHRVVELRQQGQKLFLAFPVIGWRLAVDGNAEVEVNGNEGPPEHAYIRSMGVAENGVERASWENPSTGNNNAWTVYDDGRRLISIPLEVQHDPWEAPQLVVGESVTLEDYLCPPAGSSDLPPWLVDQCATEGQRVFVERYGTWEQVSVRAQMGAHSGSWHLPFDPILSLVDGGEALACFGLDSPMGSFDLGCESEGITTSVEAEVINWVQYRVRAIGGNAFLVIDDNDEQPVPLAIPALAPWALITLVMAMAVTALLSLRRQQGRL